MGALKILVVDDNVDAAAALRIALEMFGYDVAVATDGEHALTVFAQHQPSLAFLDIGMPGLSGHQLAKLFRDAGKPIRLVAVSGWGQPSDIAASIAAGFDEHLTKPASIEAVLELARRTASELSNASA